MIRRVFVFFSFFQLLTINTAYCFCWCHCRRHDAVVVVVVFVVVIIIVTVVVDVTHVWRLLFSCIRFFFLGNDFSSRKFVPKWKIKSREKCISVRPHSHSHSHIHNPSTPFISKWCWWLSLSSFWALYCFFVYLPMACTLYAVCYISQLMIDLRPIFYSLLMIARMIWTFLIESEGEGARKRTK